MNRKAYLLCLFFLKTQPQYVDKTENERYTYVNNHSLQMSESAHTT